MSQDVLGNSVQVISGNGFTGVNLSSGAYIGYRNPKRSQQHTGSGAGSAEFAAQDPRRIDGPNRDMGNATPGAEPPAVSVPDVQNQQVNSQYVATQSGGDDELRAVLKVPPEYTSGEFGKIFASYGGVLFPYTPQITIENKADYSSVTPLHSNYPINFYKSSGISDISITANFTVQTDEDAYYYLGAKRILSAVTKMRFGKDPLAGNPPPICRLSAYGEWVLKNVPVVVASVRQDLSDDVDYYTTYVRGNKVSVPTKSSLVIVCKPTYSRNEMKTATVSSFLQNTAAGKGYL